MAHGPAVCSALCRVGIARTKVPMTYNEMLRAKILVGIKSPDLFRQDPCRNKIYSDKPSVMKKMPRFNNLGLLVPPLLLLPDSRYRAGRRWSLREYGVLYGLWLGIVMKNKVSDPPIKPMLLACQSGAYIHQRCDRVAPRKVCAANLSGYSLALFRLQTVNSLRFDKRFSSHVETVPQSVRCSYGQTGLT